MGAGCCCSPVFSGSGMPPAPGAVVVPRSPILPPARKELGRNMSSDMRTPFLALLTAALTSPGYGQETVPPNRNTPYERVEVVEVEGKSSDELYKAAKRWFVDAFKDASSVVQLDDPNAHTVVGKGNFRYKTYVHASSGMRKGTMRFSVEVSTKEGRYRVRFYDFVHEGSRLVTSSGAVASAINLGVILSGQDYCTGHYNRRNKPDYEPSKHEAKVCVEEVWPQIHTYEELMLGTMKAAMEGQVLPGKQPVDTDW